MKFTVRKSFNNDNKYTEDSKFADDFWINVAQSMAIIAFPPFLGGTKEMLY
jgi:hypothetical protein